MLTPTLRQRWGTTYWGYPDGMPRYTAPEDKKYWWRWPTTCGPRSCGRTVPAIGNRVSSASRAPPLHGVWATAPYFHNGAVPTLEQVLDSSLRPDIWRRKLQTEGPVTGFDQRLATAFDFDAVGWKHDELSCDQMPGTLLMNCIPVNDKGPSLPQLVTNYLNNSLSWAGLVTIHDPDPDGFDKRLIFDTRTLGSGNGGHTFFDVLTPAERRAIIEYLKTL